MIRTLDGHLRNTALTLNASSLENQAIGTGDIKIWHRTKYGLDLGDTQRVETRQGTAYVREAAPTEQFWKAWRKNKGRGESGGVLAPQLPGRVGCQLLV